MTSKCNTCNSEWIKIEDKKPELEQDVYYYFHIVGVYAGNYFRPEIDEDFPGQELMDCFESKSGFLCDDVTHWMDRCSCSTMPEPPKD